MSNAEFSAMLRADADKAVSGGVGSRRPCSCLPADPSTDHRVAYALSDVRDAAARAYSEGATTAEVEAACESGRMRGGS